MEVVVNLGLEHGVKLFCSRGSRAVRQGDLLSYHTDPVLWATTGGVDLATLHRGKGHCSKDYTLVCPQYLRPIYQHASVITLDISVRHITKF